METITTVAGLREAISELEAEQHRQLILLEDQFHITYESLKPANLFLSTFKEISKSPDALESALNSAIGMGTGYLAKIIIGGGSGSIVRKIISTLVQYGVSNLASSHPDGIKSLFQKIYHYFQTKQANSEKS